MKKYLILLLMAGIFSLTSCSGDDDNNGSSDDPIIGTWAVVQVAPAIIDITECEDTSTITFNENNTGNAAFYLAANDCQILTTTGNWDNLGSDVYEIEVPIVGTLTGNVEFNGSSQFFFHSDSGVQFTFERQ